MAGIRVVVVGIGAGVIALLHFAESGNTESSTQALIFSDH